jgi:hypothetical protein
MKTTILSVALTLFAVGQAAANTGNWVCMANSTYGTHGTSSHWSGGAHTRSGAEASAISKCVAFAVNKRGCAVNRCWVGRD